MLTREEILKIFKETGAINVGHFLLSSGLHSDRYLQCAKVLQYPKYCESLSKELLKKFKSKRFDLIIAPALGGITLSYEIARQLKLRGIFAEREKGAMKLRRGFEIKENERVLVVEDVITTGGSVQEVVELVKNSGGKLVGIGSIVDRSEKSNLKVVSLIKLDIKNYKKEDCPLCKDNIPIIKPGSRKNGGLINIRGN